MTWIEVLLTTADVQAGEARMLAPGLTLPPMDAVLKWGCTILDTHFITLAGLPAGAQQALKALQSQIQEMLQVCMLADQTSFSALCNQFLATTPRVNQCPQTVHHNMLTPEGSPHTCQLVMSSKAAKQAHDTILC